MTLSPNEDHARWRELADSTKRRKPGDVDFTLLNGMSDSELVALAWEMQIEGASRMLLPEDLIDIILGNVASLPEDLLKGPRQNTYTFVHGNPRLSKAEMLCDSECYVCPHHTMLACYAINEDLVDQPDNYPETD